MRHRQACTGTDTGTVRHRHRHRQAQAQAQTGTVRHRQAQSGTVGQPPKVTESKGERKGERQTGAHRARGRRGTVPFFENNPLLSMVHHPQLPNRLTCTQAKLRSVQLVRHTGPGPGTVRHTGRHTGTVRHRHRHTGTVRHRHTGTGTQAHRYRHTGTGAGAQALAQSDSICRGTHRGRESLQQSIHVVRKSYHATTGEHGTVVFQETTRGARLLFLEKQCNVHAGGAQS
jgi:hypothetical protein